MTPFQERRARPLALHRTREEAAAPLEAAANS